MAIIALSGSFNMSLGIGSVDGLNIHFKSAIKTSDGLQKSLSSLKIKIKAASSAAKVDVVLDLVKKADTREKAKNTVLTTAYDKLDKLIVDVGKVDQKVSNLISSREDDFYKAYSYLKPECKKSTKEKVKQWFSDRWDDIKGAWKGLKNAIKSMAKKLKDFCEKVLKKVLNILNKGLHWVMECWEELLITLGVIVLAVVTWPYSLAVIAGFALGWGSGKLASKGYPYLLSLFTDKPYDYDPASGESMAKALGIDYEEFIKTMGEQYGVDERFCQSYLKLYLEVANSRGMRGKSNEDVACEFNRIIASLCLNYNGSAKRWWLTTGNYDSKKAYNMLMNKYGFSKDEAVDFAIELNVQHGSKDINHPELSSCQYAEKEFGFSHNDGITYKNITFEPTINARKDLPHEAVQYVEFNDSFDLVDLPSGSTDRMISYSGDIVSGRYDAQDFQSDIDANNIQKRLKSGKNNFITVQQDYNLSAQNGTIDTKKEFITNNGDIEKIRDKINYDIRHTMSGYIDRGNSNLLGHPKNREKEHKKAVDDFIEFLEN